MHTAQARFHREVAILKACRNRNIVSFLGQFAHDQQTWLIMEYMEVCHRCYRQRFWAHPNRVDVPLRHKSPGLWLIQL